MLQKTRGIVFKATRYGETSLICKIYTEKFGLQNYIVSGVRTVKARTKASVYQPLMIIDLVVYQHDTKSLKRIKEAKPAIIYTNLPFNIIKSSVGLFIIEALNKCVKEEESNAELFQFITESLLWFDRQPSHYTDFHLLFLARLATYLGFSLQGAYSEQTPYFDLNNGSFVSTPPHSSFIIEGKLAKEFSAVIHSDYEQAAALSFSRANRSAILDQLLLFYRLHLEGFGVMKSPKVIHEILKD